uniref:Uncharacterized protein n=1 Tax=Caenorhabditis japonica TaxID=281687 RepID=A0A8R1I0C8_CAEJA
MVIKKWLEIHMLFEIKYAMKGYTMEDRGHHLRRDGSVKDDLSESWTLFPKLEFLVNPNFADAKPEKHL